MEIIPAIDIVRGKTVRLTQGDYTAQTDYGETPVDFARHWSSHDVNMLHIIDLDGARAGSPKNLNVIKEIIQEVEISIETGGGIRDEKNLNQVIEAGVQYAVIGTMALDEDFLKVLAKKYSKNVVVSIDAKNGMVQTRGWIDDSGVQVNELVKRLEGEGIERINFTEVTRDGTLSGPDLIAIEALLKTTKLSVVAAGGVTTLTDIKNLRELESSGLVGVIIGKALYEGTINLEKAIKIASKKD